MESTERRPGKIVYTNTATVNWGQLCAIFCTGFYRRCALRGATGIDCDGSGIGEHIPSDAVLASGRNCAWKMYMPVYHSGWSKRYMSVKLNQNFLYLKYRVYIYLKGSSDAKLSFTCYLNINVCWQCVYTTTL